MGEQQLDKPLRIPPQEMAAGAHRASDFLKILSHEARLKILCLLLEGEKSVSQLMEALDMRQASVSQQLQRLRAERLVQTRRQGKEIIYSISSHEVEEIMGVLYEIFCSDKGA